MDRVQFKVRAFPPTVAVFDELRRRLSQYGPDLTDSYGHVHITEKWLLVGGFDPLMVARAEIVALGVSVLPTGIPRSTEPAIVLTLTFGDDVVLFPLFVSESSSADANPVELAADIRDVWRM